MCMQSDISNFQWFNIKEGFIAIINDKCCFKLTCINSLTLLLKFLQPKFKQLLKSTIIFIKSFMLLYRKNNIIYNGHPLVYTLNFISLLDIFISENFFKSGELMIHGLSYCIFEIFYVKHKIDVKNYIPVRYFVKHVTIKVDMIILFMKIGLIGQSFEHNT